MSSRFSSRLRRPRLDRRRIVRRFAAGHGPEHVARLEGADLGDIMRLLVSRGFQDLINNCAALMALPPLERQACALEAAWQVIEMALEEGDVRVAMLVVREAGQGRVAAQTLAQAILAQLERCHLPCPAAIASAPHPGAMAPPAEPVDMGAAPRPPHLGAIKRSLTNATHDLLVSDAKDPPPVLADDPSTPDSDYNPRTGATATQDHGGGPTARPDGRRSSPTSTSTRPRRAPPRRGRDPPRFSRRVEPRIRPAARHAQRSLRPVGRAP